MAVLRRWALRERSPLAPFGVALESGPLRSHGHALKPLPVPSCVTRRSVSVRCERGPAQDDEGLGAGHVTAATDAVDDALEVLEVVDADTNQRVGITGGCEHLDDLGNLRGALDVVNLGLSREARGRITPSELSGATFTVSYLGMYGMTAITPVVNVPQAAILGVGAARSVLARVDGEIVDRQLMTLTLSCDHRILYGAGAARFLSRIRELLEQPLRLAL